MKRDIIRFFLFALMAMCITAVPQANANLVTDGGFESVVYDSSQFDTDYLYSSGLYPARTFFIGSNPNTFHSAWGSFGAYEGNDMMIINGAVTSSNLVWGQDITGIIPNTSYYFSAWVASSYSTNPASLNFSIDSTLVGTSFTPGPTIGLWQQFYVTWLSGSNSSARIEIINTNLDYDGNDFALDNLQFDTRLNPVPEPATMLIFGAGLVGLAGLRIRRKK